MRNAQDNAAHTCSYSCDRPECIKAQRDELADAAAQEAVAWRDDVGNLYPSKESVDKYLPRGRTVHALYAAPVAAAPATYFPLTLRGLIAYGQVAADPSQRAVPNHMRYLIEQMVPHLKRLDEIESNTPAAPGIDLAALRARVVSAIERITSGTASMRIPADMTDPDLVLGDVLCLLDRLGPQIDASPKGGSEARDAARYRWLRDLSGNAPTDTPSAILLDDYGDSFKYIDGPQLDAAIDAAMQAQAGDAEVQP